MCHLPEKSAKIVTTAGQLSRAGIKRKNIPETEIFPMRIVAFGDIHMAAPACRNIPGAGDADLLIATGDLTNFGHVAQARTVVEELQRINPRLLGVIGNLDHFAINGYLDQLDINLHGQARLVGEEVYLLGVGGSNITPFATPTEYSEEELADILMRGHQQMLEMRARQDQQAFTPATILVSHAPPSNTGVDRLTNGRHVGSTAVRSYIERYQPALCLTGHIHEARGEDQLGITRIVNPGMLRDGGWVEITVNQSTLTVTLT